jgi:hypothetical protein
MKKTKTISIFVMRKSKKYCRFVTFFWYLVFILFFSLEGMAFDRRKEQFQKDFGYYIVPAFYSIPGIGSGPILVAGANNMFDTYMDVAGVNFYGDLEGHVLALMDIHLVEQTLILDGGSAVFDKFGIQTYRGRGMDTEKDDYFYLEGSEIKGNAVRALLTFFDRRVEAYAGALQGGFQLDRMRDKDGNLISEVEEKKFQKTSGSLFGLTIDLADDRLDPLKGIRFDIVQTQTNRPDDFSPEYFVMDYNLSGYLPVGEFSTMVFNYFRSEAIMKTEGETDPDKLRERFGLRCSQISDAIEKTECEELVTDYIANKILENANGTATTLGGQNRLRSYPQGRFRGAFTQFYGVEFRWNLSDDSNPFDIWIMRDVQIGSQIAFFTESGSVAEEEEELGKETRQSYGLGYRLVTKSGAVYRFDYGIGDEGSQTTVTIFYPWGGP